VDLSPATSRMSPGNVVADDVTAADHVLGVLLQPAVREELVAVVRVLRHAMRDDAALHLEHECEAVKDQQTSGTVPCRTDI